MSVIDKSIEFEAMQARNRLSCSEVSLIDILVRYQHQVCHLVELGMPTIIAENIAVMVHDEFEGEIYTNPSEVLGLIIHIHAQGYLRDEDRECLDNLGLTLADIGITESNTLNAALAQLGEATERCKKELSPIFFSFSIKIMMTGMFPLILLYQIGAVIFNYCEGMGGDVWETSKKECRAFANMWGFLSEKEK